MRRFALTVAATSAAFVLAACAAESSGGGGGSTGAVPPAGTVTRSVSSEPVDSCPSDSLPTINSGNLTVATDSPAYGPWFVDNKPSNGKGFESAVAYAVAKQLGYLPDEVHWTVASFNSVISPAPKKFDFDINEVSITPQRAKVVDFSSGYYDVTQAVVALKSSKYANAKSIADLHGAKLAAQQGTTSFDAINNVLKTGRTPAEFPTNDLAVEALKNGQVDGIVVDLPTGFYITSAQVTDAKIVGQLPVGSKPEQFGLVLDKDSPLTDCVSAAVELLRANGTLDKLQHKWLATAGGAPELK